MSKSVPALFIRKGIKRTLSMVVRTCFMGTITRVQTSEPVLALTFDDGPHPYYTAQLLDILDKHQAKVTFFCVGKFASKYPELIRRAAEAGHLIGNHTWDHPSLPLLPHIEQHHQIQRCREALKPYGTSLFRAPYGDQDASTWRALVRYGYQSVGWTKDSGDWRLRSADRILEGIQPYLSPGSVLFFHDRIAVPSQSPEHFDRSPTLDAVDLLLQQLRGRYRLVTVTELMKYGQVVREAWCNEGTRHALRIEDPELGE